MKTIPVKMCISCQKCPIHPLTYCAFCGRILENVQISRDKLNDFRKQTFQTGDEIKSLGLIPKWHSIRIPEDTTLPFDAYEAEGKYDNIRCLCGSDIYERTMGEIVECPKCHRKYKRYKSPDYYKLIEDENENV